MTVISAKRSILYCINFVVSFYSSLLYVINKNLMDSNFAQVDLLL